MIGKNWSTYYNGYKLPNLTNGHRGPHWFRILIEILHQRRQLPYCVRRRNRCHSWWLDGDKHGVVEPWTHESWYRWYGSVVTVSCDPLLNRPLMLATVERYLHLFVLEYQPAYKPSSAIMASCHRISFGQNCCVPTFLPSYPLHINVWSKSFRTNVRWKQSNNELLLKPFRTKIRQKQFSIDIWWK